MGRSTPWAASTCWANSPTSKSTPLTNTWLSKAPMLTPRGQLLAAAAANCRIYAVAGTNHPLVESSVNEEYDPVANHWTTRAPLPGEYEGFGLAAASNGKLYAV